MPDYTGWGTAKPTGIVFGADSNPIRACTGFQTSLSGQSVIGTRLWCNSEVVAGAPSDGIITYLMSGLSGGYPTTVIATGAIPTLVSNGWVSVSFGAPIPISANTPYYICVWLPGNVYSVKNSAFTADVAAPSGASGLTFFQDTTTHHNGVYHYMTNATPDSSFGSSFYGVDITLNGDASVALTGTVIELAMVAPAGTVSTSSAANVALTGVSVGLALAAPAGTVTAGSPTTNVALTGVTAELAIASLPGTAELVSNITDGGVVAALVMSAPAGTAAATSSAGTDINLVGAEALLVLAAQAGTLQLVSQTNVTIGGTVASMILAAPAGYYSGEAAGRIYTVRVGRDRYTVREG